MEEGKVQFQQKSQLDYSFKMYVWTDVENKHTDTKGGKKGGKLGDWD